MNVKSWENPKHNILVLARKTDGEIIADGLHDFIKVYRINEYGNMLQCTDLYTAIATETIKSYDLSPDEWDWLDTMADVFEEYAITEG